MWFDINICGARTLMYLASDVKTRELQVHCYNIIRWRDTYDGEPHEAMRAGGMISYPNFAPTHTRYETRLSEAIYIMRNRRTYFAAKLMALYGDAKAQAHCDETVALLKEFDLDVCTQSDEPTREFALTWARKGKDLKVLMPYVDYGEWLLIRNLIAAEAIPSSHTSGTSTTS